VGKTVPLAPGSGQRWLRPTIRYSSLKSTSTTAGMATGFRSPMRGGSATGARLPRRARPGPIQAFPHGDVPRPPAGIHFDRQHHRARHVRAAGFIGVLGLCFEKQNGTGVGRLEAGRAGDPQPARPVAVAGPWPLPTPRAIAVADAAARPGPCEGGPSAPLGSPNCARSTCGSAILGFITDGGSMISFGFQF